MAGSPPAPNEEPWRTREANRQYRRRSRTPEGVAKRRVSSPDKAERREREHVREPKKPGTSLTPQFSSSYKHPRLASPPHHRHRGRSRSRGRSYAHPTKEFADGDRQTSNRRERSSGHKPYHSHQQLDSSTSHKRRQSRSPSSSTRQDKHHKRRRSISPSAPSSQIEGHRTRVRTDNRARSPRPAQSDDTVAARRPPSEFNASHQRRRSRSIESGYGGDAARARRPPPLESQRRAPDDSHHRHRRHSPKRESGRRYPRSPPPPSGYRPKWDSDRRGVRDKEHYREARERHSPTSPRELHPRSRRGHSRSPPGPTPNPESGRTLPREPDHATHRSNRETQRHRSLSRESPPSREGDKERDTDMYGRGPPYDPRYGGYPPAHTPRGHHSYPPSSYGSHAGSPVHGYPPQHSPYSHQQPPSQPGVPYYQPQPGKQYGGAPNHPVYPSARDSMSRSSQRGGPAGRGGRGHFANLSWTPGSGVTGGHLVKPSEKENEREGSASAATKPQPASVIGRSEDDDNPFRPPADLRADDESARKKRKISISEKQETTPKATSPVTKTEAEKKAEVENAKNKISFSIKGRASAAAAEKALPPSTPKPQASPEQSKKAPVPVSPLVQNAVPKSKNYEGNKRLDTAEPSLPPTKKETVRKKRIKARPELTEEFAQSESVYFRKTGNESVVGTGTYGKVYKAVHVYTGGMVALKKIRMEGERDGVCSRLSLYQFDSLTASSFQSQLLVRSSSCNHSITSTSLHCEKSWSKTTTASWSLNTFRTI